MSKHGCEIVDRKARGMFVNFMEFENKSSRIHFKSTLWTQRSCSTLSTAALEIVLFYGILKKCKQCTRCDPANTAFNAYMYAMWLHWVKKNSCWKLALFYSLILYYLTFLSWLNPTQLLFIDLFCNGLSWHNFFFSDSTVSARLV